MRNKFSNRERKLLAYTSIFLVVLLVMWVVFAPNRGIFDLMKSQKKLETLQAENQKLKAENKTLQEEIDRLQNDPAYLEEKARKDYGMLKKNEVLYIFKKKE